MATSFETITAAQRHSSQPDWITQLQVSSGFVASDLSGTSDLSSAPETQGSSQSYNLEKAYREGEQAGRSVAEKEFAENHAMQMQFKLALDGLNAAATAALKSTLANTVAQLCEQVIEPALIDREALNKRCEQAMSALGEAPGKLTLNVHPDDAALLEVPSNQGIKVEAISDLPRGTIRLEGPDGMICDGPEEWRRILREVLGQ